MYLKYYSCVKQWKLAQNFPQNIQQKHGKFHFGAGLDCTNGIFRDSTNLCFLLSWLIMFLFVVYVVFVVERPHCLAFNSFRCYNRLERNGMTAFSQRNKLKQIFLPSMRQLWGEKEHWLMLSLIRWSISLIILCIWIPQKSNIKMKGKWT